MTSQRPSQRRSKTIQPSHNALFGRAACVVLTTRTCAVDMPWRLLLYARVRKTFDVSALVFLRCGESDESQVSGPKTYTISKRRIQAQAASSIWLIYATHHTQNLHRHRGAENEAQLDNNSSRLVGLASIFLDFFAPLKS